MSTYLINCNQSKQAVTDDEEQVALECAAEIEVTVVRDEQAVTDEEIEVTVARGEQAATAIAKRLKEKIRKKNNKKKNQVEKLKMKGVQTRDNICWKGVQVDSKSEAA